MADARFVLVITPDAEAAPTALFFARLAWLQPEAVRLARYRHDRVAALLGQACAVVFVRGLFEFGDLVRCAGWLGIPRYYFVDDHLILVREDGGAAAPFVADHTEANVIRMLRDFAGVLVSTPALRDDFRRRQVHASIRLFPPAMPVAAPAPASQSRELHVAFFGGSHLHSYLVETIVPALRQLARRRPLTLIAAGLPGDLASSEGLTIRQLPYEPSYATGLARMRELGIDVLIHPVAPGLRNNPFKNAHALITAHALGAVPVVSAAPPYAGLDEAGVAVLCADSPDSWLQGLLRAVDAEQADGLRERLAVYCEREFSGTANLAIWHDLLARHPRPNPLTAAFRTLVAAAWIAASLLRRHLPFHRRSGA